MIKRFLTVSVLFMGAVVLSGCSTNPATGQSQFTALMSPAQENKVGAEEHQKILKEFGLYQNKSLQSYVNRIGQAVVMNTERKDVQYKFFVLDSPIVNAFALPGGYIYLSRGLVSLANSEAEMASVLAHEAGHITGRHSAERYSRGVVTSLGAAIISTAVGSSGISQALGLGSNLYLKSYSRGQESQADSLGIRYLSRAGYDPDAMSAFLYNLQAESAIQAKIADKKKKSAGYFSTHPATSDRVAKTIAEARAYPQTELWKYNEHLRMIDGMVYGDSVEQGLIRGQDFIHPKIGFKFSVPNGYRLVNGSTQVAAAAKSGALIVFDMVNNKNGFSPMRYLKEVWRKGEPVSGAQDITVNGMSGASASVQGAVNGKAMQIRLIAIKWSDNRMVRFQVAIPNNATQGQIDALRRSTYSYKRLTNAEKQKYRPYRIKAVKGRSGDTVVSMAAEMAHDNFKEERFRVLNGLKPRDKIQVNRLYKIVVE